MLIVDFGQPDDCMWNSDLEFDVYYESSWRHDDFVKEIIRSIDNAEFVDGALRDLDDPELEFSIYDISGGAKALILLYKDDSLTKVWGPLFGDNCSELLLRIAENKDITVYMQHLLKFPEDKFKAYSNRLGREYKDYRDYEIDLMWGIPEVIKTC